MTGTSWEPPEQRDTEAPAAPAGWYPTAAGQQFWDGRRWVNAPGAAPSRLRKRMRKWVVTLLGAMMLLPVSLVPTFTSNPTLEVVGGMTWLLMWVLVVVSVVGMIVTALRSG